MVINEMRLSPEHKCFGHVLTRRAATTPATSASGTCGPTSLAITNWSRTAYGTPPGSVAALASMADWAAYNFNHYYFHSPYFLNNAEPHIRQGMSQVGQTDIAYRLREARPRRRTFSRSRCFYPGAHRTIPGARATVPPEWAERLPRRVDIRTVAELLHCKQDPYANDWLWQYHARRLRRQASTTASCERTTRQTASLDVQPGSPDAGSRCAAGVADDTIFVFTADHGEMFGSHTAVRYAKQDLLRRGLHAVPFMVRWPKKIAKKTVTDAALCTPDIMPTLLVDDGLAHRVRRSRGKT